MLQHAESEIFLELSLHFFIVLDPGWHNAPRKPDIAILVPHGAGLSRIPGIKCGFDKQACFCHKTLDIVPLSLRQKIRSKTLIAQKDTLLLYRCSYNLRASAFIRNDHIFSIWKIVFSPKNSTKKTQHFLPSPKMEVIHNRFIIKEICAVLYLHPQMSATQ